MRDHKRGEGRREKDREEREAYHSNHHFRYYQLVEDDENKPLNSGEPSLSHTVTVTELNEQLVRIIQPIYDNICAGRGVSNYLSLIPIDIQSIHSEYCLLSID